MTKDEALHKALKVLNCLNNDKVYETAWVKGAINACEEALEQPAQKSYDQSCYDTHPKQPTQEPVADDELHLAKHAKEYHGLTLNQFKLMCNEADKRYEGQFANSVDKHLAVESFYKGFKVGCTRPHQWQGLTDDEIEYWECLKAPPVHPDFLEDDSWREFARCIEQALRIKNDYQS